MPDGREDDDLEIIEQELAKSDTPKAKKEEVRPSFKFYADSKIPVSSVVGKLWSQRKGMAIKKRNDNCITEAWQQALEYYENDQIRNRDNTDPNTLNSLSMHIGREYHETENIIFANVAAAAPALYAKNPDCEITNVDLLDPALEQSTDVYEKLIDALLNKKMSPGVNAKPKIRRMIVSAFLFNLGWMEVGYVNKDDSVEQAYKDLEDISAKLAKEKDLNKIREYEGQLIALERRVNFLNPSGPFLRYVAVDDILRDPMGIEEDLSDCSWVMCKERWPTDVLNAMFGEVQPDGSVKSIYQPTNDLGTNNEDNANNLLDRVPGLDDESDYGTEEGNHYKNVLGLYEDSKHITLCWRVWDKATRRVLLYADNDWTFPIWVWDDPYNFRDFFPYVPLSFYHSPSGGESKGEVSYILDQQDSINLSNTVLNRAKHWAATRVAYNSTALKKEDFDRVINAKALTGFPVDLQENRSLKDVIWAVELPAMSNPQLFDKTNQFNAIDRISSVSDVQRGLQYKTNTTNKAIEQYSEIGAARFDNPIDNVEEALSAICQKLLILCTTRMEKEDVARIIGQRLASSWVTLNPDDANELPIRVIGGSTQKPTSKAKKEMALEIAQILGQFGSTNPLSFVIAMKVLERAFDEVVVTKEEWAMLQQQLAQALMGPPQSPNPEETNDGSTAGPPNGSGAGTTAIN